MVGFVHENVATSKRLQQAEDGFQVALGLPASVRALAVTLTAEKAFAFRLPPGSNESSPHSFFDDRPDRRDVWQ